MFSTNNNKNSSTRLNDKWNKEGDFSPQAGYISRRVSYIDLLGEKDIYDKPMMKLNIYEINGVIELSYRYSILRKDGLADYCKLHKPEFISQSQQFTILVKTNDKTRLNEFINLVDRFNHLGDQIKTEILNYLGIETSAEKIEEEIKRLLAGQQVSNAIDVIVQSQNNHHYHIIWNFLRLFQSQHPGKVSDEQLFNLYLSVKNDNPHFNVSRELFVKSLLDQSANNSPAENRNRLKLAFRCAVNAEMKDQKLIDQLFHFLCGNTSDPIIAGVKGDCDTLLSIAERMSGLAAHIQTLESSIAERGCSSRLRL